MGSLSTSIVEREIATMRQVEEALARQVLYGGDLATNLLEVLGGTSEGALTYVLAEHYALRPAPTGELRHPSEDVVRLVPADTATRHGFCPLGIENGALVVAVAEPLPREVEDELTFTLGMPLIQLAAPLVRVRQALARVYKQALDRRLLRLLAKLSGFPDPMPSSMPPPLSGGPLGGFRAPRFPRAFGDEPTTKPGIGEKTEAETPDVRLPDPEAAAEARAAIGIGRVATPTRRLIKWMARSARTHAASRGRRHRGPLTLAGAEEALSECAQPEDALLTFFDFAKQFMTYAALFVVHGDLAEGRDAFGPGTGRDEVAGIGVPLDLPSIFAHAKNRGAPVCAPLERDGIDAQLAKDLGRAPKGNVVAVPVVVRRRTVAIVYGDDGDHGVELDEIGEVVGVASLVAAVLEKLAVLKKRERAATPAPPDVAPVLLRRDTLLGMAVPVSPPPVFAEKEKKQEALVRALGLPPPEARVGLVMPAPTPLAPHADEPPTMPGRRTTQSFSKHQTPPPEAPTPAAPEVEVGTSEESDDLLHLAMDEIGGAPPSSEPPPPDPELDEHGNPLSRSSYHPPRQPPSPRKMQSLPSVIVDVGDEQTQIVDRLLGDDGTDEDVLGDVLREGVIVVPPILARLPGPLLVTREALLEGSARPSAAGPLFRALVALRRTALPFVVVHSANVEREPRLFATLLLGELPYPEAANAVVARMFDPDEVVRRAAAVAARLLKSSPEVWTILVGNLERILRSPSEHDARRVTAAAALGELSAVTAIPTLIAVLQKEPRLVREAARTGLRRITCQDFGTDVEFWDAWWSERGAEDRAEWLFDALTHESPELREQAARELGPVVPMDTSGFASMSEAGRQELQARCRRWWREGRGETDARDSDPRRA